MDAAADDNVFIVVGTLTSPAGSGPSTADVKHHSVPIEAASLHNSSTTIVTQREVSQGEESHNPAGQNIHCVPLACIKQEVDQEPVPVGAIYRNEYATVINADLGASTTTTTITDDSASYPQPTAAQQHFQLPSFSTVIQQHHAEEESSDAKPVAEDLTSHRRESAEAENASLTSLKAVKPEVPTAVVAEDLTSGSGSRQGSSVVVVDGRVATTSFCTSSGDRGAEGGVGATAAVQIDEDDLPTQVAIQFLAQKVAQQTLLANASVHHQQQQQHPSVTPVLSDPKSKRQKSPTGAYRIRPLSSSSGGGSGSGGSKKRQRLAMSLEEENTTLSAPPPAKRKQRSFTHTGVRTCVCEVCNAVLSAPASLKTHMLIHSGDKPYPCVMCSAAFRHQSTLKRHMCIHTGEKKFTCSVCQSPFARKTELTQHQRSHSTVRPFICKFCSSSYKHPKDLSQHLRAHARNSSASPAYNCSICSMSLCDADSLSEHMRTAHSNNNAASSSSSSTTSASTVLVCEVCDAKFTTLVALTQHVMKTHLPNVVPPSFPQSTAEMEVKIEGGKKTAEEKKVSPAEPQHHECSVCTQKFENAGQVMKHFKETHWTEQLKASLSVKASEKDGVKSGGEFHCKMCNAGLHSAAALAQHIKKKHWFSPEESPSPGRSKKRWHSSGEVSASPSREDGGRGGEGGVKSEGEAHTCTSCGMEYPRLKSLAQHMKKSHSINLLPCTKCGHTFVEIQEWLDHTDICS